MAGSRMNRRDLLKSAGLLVGSSSASAPQIDIEEITVADIQKGFRSGRFTAKTLTEAYLVRIDAVNRKGPEVNAVIEINPRAVEIAAELTGGSGY
jgi:amidase